MIHNNPVLKGVDIVVFYNVFFHTNIRATLLRFSVEEREGEGKEGEGRREKENVWEERRRVVDGVEGDMMQRRR